MRCWRRDVPADQINFFERTVTDSIRLNSPARHHDRYVAARAAAWADLTTWITSNSEHAQ
jgi:hypothetical protein